MSVFKLMVTAITVKNVFEAMGCFSPFCSCQESRPSLSEQEIERGNKKREVDELRREYIKERGYKIQEMWECEWWEHFSQESCQDKFPLQKTSIY